jgi:hypothetical protein
LGQHCARGLRWRWLEACESEGRACMPGCPGGRKRPAVAAGLGGRPTSPASHPGTASLPRPSAAACRPSG